MYLYILVTVIPNIALGKLQILNTLQPLADFFFKSYLLLYACSEFYNYCHPINFWNWKFRVWHCFGLLNSGHWPVSNRTLNWTEAVEFCRGVNSTPVFTVPASADPYKGYWTVKQQRMSPWVHIIGQSALPM